ncbi:GcrA cell cycle regulator [Jiella sp. MQZ9-1]|uniref:GcrA cell cycle regulator n=1 Tax=Jiella flava TaxID=2816857 RepID=A0A939JU94_9HYPH|nr:GcrA family cell cycle regulator [Jiella flava]MBO0661189.1 GcrA cell cycle regulator [Jiella flava]MCD2469834.1 GcrA cell cycle regulator [Jiella flava]
MGWTDDRVELLRQLWSEGHSASQIAERLGGVSRNAVIGKVHRLKLESRVKSADAAAAQPIIVQETVSATPVTAVAPRVIAPKVVAAQAISQSRPVARTLGATALKVELHPDEEEHVATATQTSAEVVPMTRKLSLVQLTERTCKWPIGDPLSPDFHFCGDHSGDGSPYCSYHAKLAFQAVERRRR